MMLVELSVAELGFTESLATAVLFAEMTDPGFPDVES